MRRGLRGAMGVLLLGTVLVAGCGRTDTREPVVRDIINSVYAGSLTPMEAELDPRYKPAMPDFVTAGTSAVLHQRYGAFKSLKFLSSKGIHLGATQTVWAVTGERAEFQMSVNFTREGRVVDIAFRSSPTEEWLTAMEMGVDYVKEHRQRQR